MEQKRTLSFLLLSAMTITECIKPSAVGGPFYTQHRIMRNKIDTRVAPHASHCELMVQAHAVVLGLPAKVCAGRAANRVGHEGGVEGSAAPRVVHMMHRLFVKAGPPTKAEGFASIMVCLMGATNACWS